MIVTENLSEYSKENVEAKKCQKYDSECAARQSTSDVATNRRGFWEVSIFVFKSLETNL